MDDVYGKVEVFPNHFQDTKASDECLQTRTTTDYSLRSHSNSWAVKRITGATSMLHLFSLPRLPWASSTHDDDKVEVTRAELESLRSEIADADERESHLRAQFHIHVESLAKTIKQASVLGKDDLIEASLLYHDFTSCTRIMLPSSCLICELEHLDEILKSAQLSGYLYIRTRWTELPGEPPIIDDADIDDWLPRFVVLNGSCVFYYLKSTDLSPQDSTVMSDVVEVGPLPSFVLENQQTRYVFYILTCHGLRFECSSPSKEQADSWMAAIRSGCKLEHDAIIDCLKS